jgi:hypothetical protein
MRPRWFNFPPKEPPPPPEPPVPDYLPEGLYFLEVEHIEEKMSQYHNEYYGLRCKVLDFGVHPDFRVYFVLSTTAQARWRLAEFIEAATARRPLGQFLFMPEEYIGSRFRAELTTVYFRQQQRQKVGNLFPLEYRG